MGILALVKRRRVVTISGLRFLVGPPTVETVRLALEIFSAEIYNAAKGYRTAGDDVQFGLDEIIPTFLSAPRIGRLLETCVEVNGGCPGDVEAAANSNPLTAEGLSRFVLKLCNIQRIVESLNLDDTVREIDKRTEQGEAPSAEDEEAVDDTQTIGIVRMGLVFGQPPHAVMRWSYEEFLATAEAVIAMTPPANTNGDGTSYLTDAEMLNLGPRLGFGCGSKPDA